MSFFPFLELGLSFGLEKKFIILTQDINDLPFDVRTFNAIKYNPNKLDDLHRNLREAIIQLKPIPRLSEEALVFKKNLEDSTDFIEYHVPHAEHSGPAIEILIGSKNSEQNWLLPNPKNISLLQCAPKFLFKEIKGRHEYYDFKPRYENHFLRILRNGFIISKFPSAQWDSEKGTIFIHELVKYIAQLFLFACRVMKKKGIRDSQRIRIELLNNKGHPIRFDSDSPQSWGEYDFSEYSIVLEEDFNPDNDWKSLLDTLLQIYRVICEHAGIIDITDNVIKKNLRKILGWIDELHTNYKDSGVTALNLNEIF